MVSAAIPAIGESLSRSRVTAAARRLGSELARLRSQAITSRTRVAMRLTWRGDGYAYAFYSDGDGDGVRSSDITAGLDPLLGGPYRLPYN